MEGIALALATNMLSPLGGLALPQVSSWWNAQDDLEKLRNTIEMIQARLVEAEEIQEGEINKRTKLWLSRLSHVLRQADDLFDDIRYAHASRQMEGSMLAKIRFFFSRYGSLCRTIKMANGIKSINEKLNAIKGDMDHLGPNNRPDEHPMARVIRERETSSVLLQEDEEQVIGREKEKNEIIEMILYHNYDNQNITVIPIVGCGGVGKTTLARLVFNDVRVKEHFDLTAWAYVPEKDNMVIKRKIFHAFTGENDQNESLHTIEQRILSSIETKRYLLVLDDLWTERVDLGLLKGGKYGSKVIVTTRSDVVPMQLGSIPATYRLDTLTDEESWKLFEKLAFEPGRESVNLSDIGKRIVKMCGNLPLAITLVGGSLKSKHTLQEWLQVEKDLSAARLKESDKMKAILKLSYYYLPLESKPCFAYISLFPKGYEFQKDDLVHLWMAQGYVKPGDGDECFWGLVGRNLLQCPKVSYIQDVQKYKMHDLLHDMAHEVAGEEMVVYERPEQIHDRLVHVYINRPTCLSSLKLAKRLRSLLNITYDGNCKDKKLFSETPYLRALSMEDYGCNKLPHTIGTLIHLRYLNLGCNNIEYLPNSITRLVNLQTLNLEECSNLKELPRDFVKLSNLRHLLLPNNREYDMPPRFEELTSLEQLNMFFVGKDNGIDSLRAENIRGKMRIEFRKWRTRDAIKEARRATLKDSCGLTDLRLYSNFEKEEAPPDVDKINEMLESLQLPPYLKQLKVCDYTGNMLPSRWVDELRHLEYIKISECRKCTVLPNFSGLPTLKTLVLELLHDLEYVEDGTATQNTRFFPSLEVLQLHQCYNLKGWMRESEDDGEQHQLVFPCLLKMKVVQCPKLMSMPLAPKLKSLYVANVDQNMFESNVRPNDDEEAASSSSAPPSSSTLFTSLKELHASSVNDLMLSSILSSSLCSLSSLYVENCTTLENIGERLQGLSSLRVLDLRGPNGVKSLNSISSIGCVTTLQKLHIVNAWDLTEIPKEIGNFSLLRVLWIDGCPKVMSLSSSILCLPELQELYIMDMKILTELPGENGNGKLLRLRHLQVERCPKLKSLPIIQRLASLDKLIIKRCPELKSLPTSIGGLALKMLEIRDCPDLAEKMVPGGEDRHLIKHVPDKNIHGGDVRYSTGRGVRVFFDESFDF